MARGDSFLKGAMMATIWAVSEGSYSDYRVKAVFSSKEKAEAFLDAYKRRRFTDDPDIEEFEFDPDPPTVVPTIDVRITTGGDVVSVGAVVPLCVDDVGYRGYWSGPGDWSGPRDLVWTVQTDDPERAVKVVNEKRAMIVAADVWGKEAKTRELLGIE
jgi:hypothetical protein